MKKLQKIHIVMLLVLTAACKKPDVNSTTPSYDLIVEGGINSLTHRQFIRLTKPANLYDAAVQPVSGANVSVNDGSGDVNFMEIMGTGLYTASMINNRNYQTHYKLNIDYKGKIYTATDMMLRVLPIDSSYIPLTVENHDRNFTVTIPKHIFGVWLAQRWLIVQTDKRWEPSQFDGKNEYNYSHVIGTPNALDPLKIQKRVITVGENDSLKIYKFSLSENYSTYLYNLFQETDWRGILSSNPASVKGNISGNANGFFYAIDVDTSIRAIKNLSN